MSVKRLVPLNAVELNTDPVNARRGDIYYNTIAEELRVYDGTTWTSVSAGLVDHIHTYDGAIYSVGGTTYPLDPIIDGGTP